MTPEQRAILEDMVQGITHHYDNDRKVLALALAEIDKFEDALAHIKVLTEHTGWGPLSRLAMIKQTVDDTIGRPPRLRPPPPSPGIDGPEQT